MTHTCYIGHTTTAVKERIKKPSSIKRYFTETHKENITGFMILLSISILARASDKIYLILLEVLLIGWMDGVKVALGNRGMTVEAVRQCAKDRKAWRALVHM